MVLGLALPAAAKGPGADMSGKKELQMASCPSAVTGAQTQVTEIKDGVEVKVWAKDPAAMAEIRRRVQKQADVAASPDRGSLEHTGMGTGSGQYGHCPGMVQGTRMKVEDLPDAVKMIIVAQSPDKVKELQRSTRERANALKGNDKPAPRN
jgi:TusA-related sulfurtransferase